MIIKSLLWPSLQNYPHNTQQSLHYPQCHLAIQTQLNVVMKPHNELITPNSNNNNYNEDVLPSSSFTRCNGTDIIVMK